MAGGVVIKGKVLKRYDILLIVLITVCIIFTTDLLITNAYHVWPGDATAIWSMAQQPITPGEQSADFYVPYTYRIMVPFIVHTFFNSSISGFIAISLLSFFACNVAIFKIARLYASDLLVCATISLLFSTNYTVMLTLANVCLLDIPSLAILLWATYIFLKFLLGQDKAPLWAWAVFSGLMLGGTLVKEWFLFLMPAFIIYYLYDRKLIRAVGLFFAFLPAIVAHLAVRLAMGPMFTAVQSFDVNRYLGPYLKLEFGAYNELFSAFGAVWLLLIFALLYGYRKHRGRNELYVLPILGLVTGLVMSFMALENNRYIFFTTFPLMVPLLAVYLGYLNQRISRGWLYGLLALAVLARIAMMYRPEFIESSMPFEHLMNEPAFLAFIAAMAALQVIAIGVYILAGSLSWHKSGDSTQKLAE